MSDTTEFTPSGLPLALVRSALSSAVSAIEQALEGQPIGKGAIVAVLINPVGNGKMDVQAADLGGPSYEANFAHTLLRRALAGARAAGCAHHAEIYAAALETLERAGEPSAVLQ